jgi:hypothetical protein
LLNKNQKALWLDAAQQRENYMPIFEWVSFLVMALNSYACVVSICIVMQIIEIETFDDVPFSLVSLMMPIYLLLKMSELNFLNMQK